MKLVKHISGLLSGSQGPDLSNFTFPAAKTMAPWFVAFLVGFVFASAVGLAAAHQLMPKLAPFNASDLGPQEPMVFVSGRPSEGLASTTCHGPITAPRGRLRRRRRGE